MALAVQLISEPGASYSFLAGRWVARQCDRRTFIPNETGLIKKDVHLDGG